MSESISQRLCKKCNTSYPLTSEFWYKDKKAKEGLAYICKSCAKAKSLNWHYANPERTKEWHKQYHAGRLEEVKAYRAENAEHIAEVKRAWRQNNPEKVAASKKRHYQRHKAKIAAYQKSWRAKNRKKLLADGKKYYLENAPAIRKRARDWAKANPEKALNHFHLRRARKAENGGEGFTKADKELQLRSQKGLCWWCGKEMGNDVTIDHIVSIKRGGPHSPRNIVLAHRSCNCSKGDKLPQDYSGRLF